MHRLISRRPSPAMAIAFVALLVALSGTAVALPGTNTVNSGDIVNNTIRSKDVRNNTVRSKDVRNGSLTGADVQDNSLTGADINESTLGTVPNANHANSANSANTAGSANTANSATNAGAVDGQSAAKYFYNAAADSAAVTFLSFDGLRLTGTCPSGDLQVTATTTVSDAFIHTEFNGLESENDDLLIGDEFDFFAADGDSTQGTFTYANPNGTVITGTWAGEEGGGTPGSPDCSFYGTALGS